MKFNIHSLCNHIILYTIVLIKINFPKKQYIDYIGEACFSFLNLQYI